MEALGVNEDMPLVMGMVIGFSGLGQVRLSCSGSLSICIKSS